MSKKFWLWKAQNKKKQYIKSRTIDLCGKAKRLHSVALCRRKPKVNHIKNKAKRKTREDVYSEWIKKTNGVSFNSTEQCIILPVQTLEIQHKVYHEDKNGVIEVASDSSTEYYSDVDEIKFERHKKA